MKTRSAADGLRALWDALAGAGGTLGMLLCERQALSCEPQPGPAQVASTGPHAQGHEAEYELLLEMILEGSLLHYGRSRVLAIDDPELALLLGDQLYALGLARLAGLGDLAAVGELGDLISLLAQAHARGQAGLADVIWQAGAIAVGWGANGELRAAKALAAAEDVRAEQALLDVVAERWEQSVAAPEPARHPDDVARDRRRGNICEAFNGPFNESFN